MEPVPSPFAQPPAFVFQRLVRLVTLTHLRWRLTLGLLRLVCRAWRAGVSGAVEVLTLRPGFCTSTHLLRLPAAFPSLRFLWLPRPTPDRSTALADAVAALGRLASLRALQAFHVDLPHSSVGLRWLTRLSWVELGVEREGCLTTLEALGEASSLQHLHASLSGPVRDELSAATLAAAARLSRLTSLGILGLNAQTVAALADLAPRVCLLRVGLCHPFDGALSQLLPLSCLGNLRALETSWEVLSDIPSLSCLTGLTTLAVDFSSASYAQVGEGGPAPSAVCAALLRRLTGLRSLHLWNGEREVSREALQQLSCLSQGALTSLHLYRMHNAGNEIMRTIGALSTLRTLCLMHASFDIEGTQELARLPQLTALTLLNSWCVYSTAELASAVTQVRGLRWLLVQGHPFLGREALQQLLCTLPGLELLQTTWKPQLDNEADAALCQRWWHVLQHSLNAAPGEPPEQGWAEFDAAEALELAGVA